MMSPADKPTTLQGGCHCGCLTVAFSTYQPAEDIHPRACDCSFCQKHGAAYVSDPAGTLRLTATHAEAVHRYRQGAEAAQFQLCRQCGVLVAVTFEHQGRLYGAVNAGCLNKTPALGAAAPVSPQWLDAEAKVARWRQAWVPDVQWVIADT
ncbi:GFA family protein [Xanthomonas sacchari]|uniref:GFA family protein n=1 Tax=Xanthomonas sp. SHU 308 TaxID=1591201 RepID=UPI00036034D1|nr:GFA family protein [Xanthomonas sp. SHU 308]